MGNLIRMDLYRMRKARSFKVCLFLAFCVALVSTPLLRLLFSLGELLGAEVDLFPKQALLSDLIKGQPGGLGVMLSLISLSSFFYADVENGYVKNIAGQMPKKGFTVFSKYLSSIPHMLVFMLVSLIGSLIGTVLVQKIVVDSAILDALRVFVLRLLLIESLCAILLLFVAVIQSKSLGTTYAVLAGMGLLSVVYYGIDTGLDKIFTKKDFEVANYMPDMILQESNPPTVKALVVSAIFICLFLWLSVRIFDKKDVK